MKNVMRLVSTLGLCSVLVVQGCSVVAVAAVVNHRRAANQDRATAQISKSVDELYLAELSAIEGLSDAQIINRDPEGRIIEAIVGDDQIRCMATQAGEGRSEMIIEATSADPLAQGETPAVDLSGIVLDQLQIDYRVQHD